MVLIKRVFAVIAALLLAALAVFVLMPRLNGMTSRAVSAGIGEIRARVEGSLGLTLSFESMSPSILQSVSFSRLSISSPGGRTILSAGRVRFLYDILAILRGRGSEAFMGLELEDVTIDIRLPEDRNLIDRLTALFGGEEGTAALPKMIVSGKNVVARLSIEGRGTASFEARKVSLSTLQDEPSISLNGKFSIDGARAGLGAISGPLILSGSVSRDFKKARLNLSVAADSRDFSLSTQRFELVYGDEALSLTKVKDRAPLDAAIRVDFGGGESSVSLRLDGFTPSRGLRLAGRYASLESWLEMPYTGSLTLKAPGLDLARIGYEARLSGVLPPRLFLKNRPAARAELAVHGDMKSIEIEKARVELGGERLEYAGSLRFADLSPDGLLDVNLSFADGSLAVSSSLRLVGHDGEYAALADQVTVGGVVFRDFALAAARKGTMADFNLSFRPPDSEDSGADSSPSRFSGEAGAAIGMPLVRCEGSVSLGSSPSLELSIDLETIDFGPLKAIIAALTASPEAALFLASLKLGGTLFATSDFKRLSWSAPDLTLVSKSVPGAYAFLSLSGTATTLAVKHALISASGYSLEGFGKVDFSETGRIGFEANLALKDIPYAIKGSVASQGLSVTGDYGLELSTRTVDEDTFVSIRARGLPLPIQGGLFLATVDAEGRFASLQDWSLSIVDFALVPTGEKMAVMPKIDLAGNFGTTKASLTKLRIADKVSELSGNAELAYSLAKPLSLRVKASLSAVGETKASSSPPESYLLDASYSAGSLVGFVDMVASPLVRFGKLPVLGSADGRIAIKGDLSNPDIDFSLKLRDGRFLDQSLVLSAAGSYDGKSLSLRDVSAAYQGQTIAKGLARFSIVDASSILSFAYSGAINGENLNFSLSAQGESKSAGGGSLAERLRSYEAKGAVLDFAMGSIDVASWPFIASADPQSVSFVGGSAGELRFKYATSGSISANLREPFPMRADVSGLYDGKNIDLSVQGIEFDLGLLSSLIPPSLVKIVSGKARGGFHAMGLGNDPEITGEIDLENAIIKVPGWIADDIGPFKAPIVAMGRKLSASLPSVKVGKAAVALDCQADFDHWLPSGLTASFRTLERSRVSLDAVILGIHAKGDAAADLKLALQGDVLSLDCDITLDKGTVVVNPANFNQGSGNQARPSLFLAVSANVRLGRGVGVDVRLGDFPLLTGYSDPSSLLAVSYDQAAENYTLKGSVGLRGGEVYYIQRNFLLKNGKIVFNEGNDRFEPRVTLLAELRDRNDDGPVLITLRADNAPITSFQPRLSSDPPMTESQIATLMGQNFLGASSDNKIDIRKAVISGSEFIPQHLSRALEDKVRDTFGLDMFYFKTQVLQNFFIDFAGQSSTSSGNALGRYFDQTEFYAGKYLNDSIFSHVSLSFNGDPLAGANTLTLKSSLGIDLELGMDLDTPFGQIQWKVDPKSFDGLIIRDQSLSLSWKLAY